jgi:hypothetical protein
MQIGLHLKPRHLAKLLRTSKSMKNIVDNEAYWTRVAAHAAWHDCCLMDLHPMDRGFERLQPMHHNLYYMIGLGRGYYWSMERFFDRMEECIEFYSNSTDVDDARHKQWCIKLKPMSLAERTWARMEHCGVVILSLDADGTQASMKQIAELECGKMMLRSNSGRSNETSACINKFMRAMDDEPIPAAYKRAMFKKLDDFLYELSEADHRGGVNYSFADHLANDICKF